MSLFKLLKLTVVLVTQIFAVSAYTGTKEGGAGNDEAAIFVSVAKETILLMQNDAKVKSFAKQLLSTLNDGLEINIVHNLDQVCDGKSRGDTNYAYSCEGQINLLASRWGNRSNVNSQSEERLKNEKRAKLFIVGIIHELFRASKETSPNFLSHDDAFNITTGPLKPILEKIIQEGKKVDYTDLHNTNYMPVGNACGLHFEVDNNTLYLTNIVNENLLGKLQNQENIDCREHINCDGKTFLWKCVGNICYRNGKKIQILSDGNIILEKIGQNEVLKAVKSLNKEYYFCRPYSSLSSKSHVDQNHFSNKPSRKRVFRYPGDGPDPADGAP